MAPASVSAWRFHRNSAVWRIVRIGCDLGDRSPDLAAKRFADASHVEEVKLAYIPGRVSVRVDIPTVLESYR
jgi:hypothetical protein